MQNRRLQELSAISKDTQEDPDLNGMTRFKPSVHLNGFAAPNY